jgi:hypothetical protein
MSERSTGSTHLRRCLLAASRFGFALRLFRQQSGNFFTANGAPVRIGFPGLADSIGWRQVLITPDMVGKTVAQFVAVEMKDGEGRLSPAQRHFLEVVQQAGGVALVARDPADLDGLVAKGKTPG